MITPKDTQELIEHLQAKVARLEGALLDQKIWHEDCDRILSTTPPSGDGQLRRSKHQDQIYLIIEAFSSPPATKEPA